MKIDPKPFEYAVAQAKAHLNDVRTDLLTTKAEYQSKLANMQVSEAQYKFAKREEKRQYDLWKRTFLLRRNMKKRKINHYYLSRNQYV